MLAHKITRNIQKNAISLMLRVKNLVNIQKMALFWMLLAGLCLNNQNNVLFLKVKILQYKNRVV